MQDRELIIVTPCLGTDGAERVLSQLAEAWSDSGIKVTLLQTNPSFYKDHYELSPSIERIDFDNPSSLRIVRVVVDTVRLIRIFRRNPNAVALSFMSGSSMKCAVLSFFIPNRIVMSERNDPRSSPQGERNRKVRTWSFGRADLCVFQTDFARKLFPKPVQEKGVVIPNPIKANLPDSFEGKRRHVIATACRLEAQKNLPMLIRSFQRFRDEHPDYVLEIYGEGILQDELTALISQMGLDDCVFLRGFVHDWHERIRDIAMYVCSSDYEGISNSMLEALALGVPTISTDCPVGGAALAIEDGVNGLLVPVGDDEALYSAMCAIADDDQLSMHISQEAATIRERWPLARIADMWADVIWPACD